MNAAAATAEVGGGRAPAALPGTLILAGLLAMFLPVYWWAAGALWQADEHAHGPIVLAVVAWLVWERRKALAQLLPRPVPLAGALLFGAGLLVYLAGRALELSIFLFLSQMLVAAGALLLVLGASALRLLWFALLYLVFTIPLPGPLVDALTGPLKQWISVVSEFVLHAAGYPVARTGVVLSIGQYQLLVADACAGLHSMFSLTALGTLVMYLAGRRSVLHNALMLAAILPVAFVANIVRVLLLMLITYHFGDEAGQGFLHGLAGVTLMLMALLLLVALDRGLAAVIRGRARTPSAAPQRGGLSASGG